MDGNEIEVLIWNKPYRVLTTSSGVKIAPVGEDYPPQYLLFEAIISLQKLKNEAWEEAHENYAEGQRLWLKKIIKRGQEVLRKKTQ